VCDVAYKATPQVIEQVPVVSESKLLLLVMSRSQGTGEEKSSEFSTKCGRVIFHRDRWCWRIRLIHLWCSIKLRF
jgi:hypothetical protein